MDMEEVNQEIEVMRSIYGEENVKMLKEVTVCK